MPISAECDQCGAEFQVPQVHAGKRGKCRRCGNVIGTQVATERVNRFQEALPKTLILANPVPP